jgi:hypothetical protein
MDGLATVSAAALFGEIQLSILRLSVTYKPATQKAA